MTVKFIFCFLVLNGAVSNGTLTSVCQVYYVKWNYISTELERIFQTVLFKITISNNALCYKTPEIGNRETKQTEKQRN